MLCLRVQAPFASFRTFTAGSFRPSAPFITHSAAYGLLLNLAGREMRAPDDGKSAMTRIADGLPSIEIAIGICAGLPTRQGIYQQLHNYPVGSSGKERAAIAYGSKYNITPARRVVLHGLDALIATRDDATLEAEIIAGLRGERPRYGLPFLGDNNFLPDRIEPSQSGLARWLTPLEKGTVMEDLAEEPMRLTTTIDRADMSRTQSRLFRAEDRTSIQPPESAWIVIAY